MYDYILLHMTTLRNLQKHHAYHLYISDKNIKVTFTRSHWTQIHNQRKYLLTSSNTVSYHMREGNHLIAEIICQGVCSNLEL